MAKTIAVIFGILVILLGGLWIVQGAGLVTMEPLLCIGACETVSGFSPSWIGMGVLAIAIGVLAILYGLQRRT